MTITSREHMRAVKPEGMTQAPIPMLPAGRPCSVKGCTATLSRYNRDPKDRCNACQHAAHVKRTARITGPVDTHERRKERVLAHLESGSFSTPQLAGLMRCDLYDVQAAVAELVLTGRVEQAKSHLGKWRGWRLVGGASDAGEA